MIMVLLRARTDAMQAFLQKGQQLQKGKYVVDEELGSGRFAVTYLARRQDGQKVAIKILDPSFLAILAPEEQERLKTKFLQEATKLHKCAGNPHLVQVFDPFEEDGVVFLPMEYVDGNSLAGRADRVLTEKLALEYMGQMGEALAAVHAKGLVHCDVRPGNILRRVGKDGRTELVLMDFGLTLEMGGMLTRTRERERSNGFSPPELCQRGMPVGAYTDVYALAATLYELLTGVVPVGAIDRGLKHVELESPQVKNSLISEKTARAILAGLEMDEDDRPQTVRAWLEMLGLSKKLGGKVIPLAESPLIAKKPWNWQTIWTAAGVMTGILIAMWGAWKG
jgi:eukaryotic-like serine/threonine-protein kinase